MKRWSIPGVIAFSVGLHVACGATEPSSDPPDAAAGDADVREAETDANVDSGPRSRCTDGQRHTFCDDFEGPLLIGGPDAWTRSSVFGAGRLRIADRTLRAEVIVEDGGQTYNVANLWLETPWRSADGGARADVVFRFRANIARCSASGEPAAIVGFLGGTDSPPHYYRFAGGIEMARSSGDCALSIVATASQIPDAGFPAPVRHTSASTILLAEGVWNDYVVRIVEATAGAVTITLQVGASSLPLSFAAPVTNDHERVSLAAGIARYGSEIEARIDTDDVRIDVPE